MPNTYTTNYAIPKPAEGDLAWTDEYHDAMDIIDEELNDRSEVGHTHDDRYYTEAEVDAMLGGELAGVTDHGDLTGLADDDHTQYFNTTRGDARYYTESEITTFLAGKSDTSHTHDSRYYTETEMDALLLNKAAASHNHPASGIVSGTVATARLGSGTADATTFLRGDQTYAVPVGNVAADPIIDAKGDLIVGTGANTAIRRAVGTNGQVLTADSAETDGVKWATPAASGSVATDTIWDAAGDLAVGSGADTAAKLVKGSDGQVLTIDPTTHLPVWSTPGTGAVATDAIWDAAGDLAVGTGANTAAKLVIGTDGYKLASTGSTPAWEADYAAIAFVIDGGGSAITTGIKGDLEVPFACVIERVTMLADVSGSIVVDIWRDTYANYPPVVGDSITASAKPTITTATKSQDSTLSGWTTALAAGDTLRFNVDSITTTGRCLVSLRVRKT